MSDDLKKYRHYIDGTWHDPATGRWFESDDPFRASPWALVARGDADDAHRAVTAAREAFTRHEWSALTATARGNVLRRIGDLLDSRAEELAETRITRQRQAYGGGRSAVALPVAWFSLLRGSCRQDPGKRHSPGPAECLQLHPPRAAGRGRCHYPLELTAHAGGMEDGPCPCRR